MKFLHHFTKLNKDKFKQVEHHLARVDTLEAETELRPTIARDHQPLGMLQ